MNPQELVAATFKPVPIEREMVTPRFALTGLTPRGYEYISSGHAPDNRLMTVLLVTEWAIAGNLKNELLERNNPKLFDGALYVFVSDIDKPFISIYMDELMQIAKDHKVDVLQLDLDLFVTSPTHAC